MKKSKQELALSKLQAAQKLFEELELSLVSKEEGIKKKSRIKTLTLCAQNYATGLKDLQYDACVQMYRIFKVNTNTYPVLTVKFKEMLRRIIDKFFSNSSSQKHGQQQMELF